MKENEYSEFKMGNNSVDGIDTPLQEQIENVRLEKLSNRITFISIFIPCLLGIVIFLAYIDIKKRVTTVHDTGTTTVQDLSKDLETKLSELTSKYKTIETNISSLQTEIKEATTAIKYIRSARKSDNQNFKTSIANLEKNITDSVNDLKRISSELKTIETNHNNKTLTFSKKIDKITTIINKINSDISNLSSTKLDRKTFNFILENNEKIYDQKLNKLIKDIEKKILSSSTRSEPLKIQGEITEQDIQ